MTFLSESILTGTTFVSGVASNSEPYSVSSTAFQLTDDGYVAATVEKIIKADKAAPLAKMSGKDFLKWLDDL